MGEIAVTELHELRQRQGTRVEITLDLIHPYGEHRLELIAVFHPFCHDTHPQLMREGGDGLDEERLPGVTVDRGDKGSVDLTP